MTLPKYLDLALKKVSTLNQATYDVRNLRFSRNNWGRDKNGKRANYLQTSTILLSHEHAGAQLELIVVVDITGFNSSPDHFYKLTYLQEDGTETTLLQGTLEQEGGSLTAREKEIMAKIVSSKTTSEIARELFISPETVNSHRKNLLNKTQSTNSIDLLRYGYAQGWL